MGEQILLRSMLLQATRDIVPNSQQALAVLVWCKNNRAAAGLPKLNAARGLKGKDRKAAKSTAGQWKVLCQALANFESGTLAEMPAVMQTAGRLARVLELSDAEAAMLCIVVAAHRLDRVCSLAWCLKSNGVDLARMMVELSGLKTVEVLRQSKLMQLGLIEIQSGRGGEVEISTGDATDRVLNAAPGDDDRLIESLVGTRTKATLKLADFPELGDDVGLIRRLLDGALKDRVNGVNILLYGPPGTGKTELAKALAQAVNVDLFSVGETDDYGEEPSRWDRLTSLKLAQRVLAGRGDAVLLFDEMEDLIGDVSRDFHGNMFSSFQGSKVFVNRLLEANPVATIWTSNDIASLDPAFLRRMSFVLKMDMPAISARTRIVTRIARDERVDLSPEVIEKIAASAPESATVARNALRSARLAGHGALDAEQIAMSLVTGIRHGKRAAPRGTNVGQLDLDLYQSRDSIAGLFGRLVKPAAPANFSLLLTGPPGTGKTALAQHLADRLDRPLIVKRASDILSKWIGESEQHIAEAFAQAAESGSVLLFDEIDSLLFDRQNASQSWQVSQVNELLTWMDTHPMPFIAATNHAAKLDPAAMRRFVFKIELEALSPGKAAKAFQLFFGAPAPDRMAQLPGLTPGDFAVVKRQVGFHDGRPSPDTLVGLLENELKAKPAGFTRIGF